VCLHLPGFEAETTQLDRKFVGALCFVSAEESSSDNQLRHMLLGCDDINQIANQKGGATLEALISSVAAMVRQLGNGPAAAAPQKAPTRKEKESDIRKLCRECPEVSDVLISSFCAAMQSSRVATALVPFPALFKRAGVGGGPQLTEMEGRRMDSRDQSAVRAAMQACRSVHEMGYEAGVIEGYKEDQVSLLWWILCEGWAGKRNLKLRRLPPVEAAGYEAGPVCVIDIEHVPGGKSTPFDDAAKATGKPMATIAYHGSAGDNFHSILRTGLENRSGGRFQRTGAPYSTLFQRCFNAVSTLFQRCLNAVSAASTLFQRCFNAVSTLFQR